MTDVALDRFAYDTNGAPFDQASKEELKQFLDCDENGSLTVSRSACDGAIRPAYAHARPRCGLARQWSGFIQMYHLQADNDVEETWK